MVEGPLLQAGITISVLAVVGLLAHRVGQSVIPAYILVGLVVGPNAPVVGGVGGVGGVRFSLVQQSEFIDLLAELGIVFLLFFIGLEFSVEQLLARRERLLAVGGVDLVVNFGLGVVLGVAFGLSALETLFLAGIVYISSSAIITKSLLDLGWIADPESEVLLGTLVFEDLVIAVYLAVVVAVARGGGTVTEIGVSVGRALGLLVVLVLVAHYGSAAIGRAFDVESDELFLLAVLGATTLVAALSLEAGVSEAVAAFFVGTAFSTTPHVQRIERVISPARDLFAAVFFFSIGLQTDVTTLTAAVDLLLVAVVLTTVGKLASGYYSGRLYDLDHRRSVRVGFGMIARGEFSLVVAALAAGVGTGALGSLIPAFTVGYVLVMSVLGTVAMRYADTVTDVTRSAG